MLRVAGEAAVLAEIVELAGVDGESVVEEVVDVVGKGEQPRQCGHQPGHWEAAMSWRPAVFIITPDCRSTRPI